MGNPIAIGSQLHCLEQRHTRLGRHVLVFDLAQSAWIGQANRLVNQPGVLASQPGQHAADPVCNRHAGGDRSQRGQQEQDSQICIRAHFPPRPLDGIPHNPPDAPLPRVFKRRSDQMGRPHEIGISQIAKRSLRMHIPRLGAVASSRQARTAQRAICFASSFPRMANYVRRIDFGDSGISHTRAGMHRHPLSGRIFAFVRFARSCSSAFLFSNGDCMVFRGSLLRVLVVSGRPDQSRAGPSGLRREGRSRVSRNS